MILSFSFVNSSLANEELMEAGKKKVINAMVTNQNSMGRYFVLALPPNENRNHPAQVAAIFVAASERTKVTLISPLGTRITKTCEPYKTVVFSSLVAGDLFSWSEEIWDSEIIQPRAWAIESEKPISVYLINSKSVSTDGYLAIPVAAWGKEYYHCAFWDFKEFAQVDWAGGFIVMASEDNTKVDIKLGGKGKGFATTNQGREIGETIKVTLNKGETYMVMGDGETRGAFDLTGTRILANKNIGVISFHNRTMIPVAVVDSGRDHLCEFMPPVQSWGKKYVTVELKRDKDMGDYFRAVASKDKTTGTVKWYDKNTKQLISQTPIELRRAGDFVELYNTSAQAPHNFPSIRGTSVWEFDQPTLLVQYSYSANWDRAAAYDPMMFLVTATEQYTKATIFQTPRNGSGSNEYTYNLFNIVAIGDPTNTENNNRLLESITLDGTKVSDREAGFLLNNIPNTNQYWAQVLVTPGPHYITGDTPFGGYIYGFASFDSYGWPAATAYKSLGEVDTLPPIPVPVGECGVYEIQTTELRNGPPEDVPSQVETGVGQEPRFLEGMYNFGTLSYELDAPWVPYPTNIDFKTFVKVIDKYADAFGNLYFVDEAGNDTTLALRYEADSIVVDPSLIDFEEVRVGTKSNELIVKVESYSDSVITIKEIKMQKGIVFNIEKSLDADVNGVIKLLPREVKEITITYSPTQEFKDVNPLRMDLDSLVIKTNCLDFAWPVIGKGVIPKIVVADFNAGIVGVNQKRCITTSVQGLSVENIGSMDLIVTGIDINATQQLPFVMSDQATISYPFPFTVKPGEKVYLKELCFEPLVIDLGQGKITRLVTFISNAGGNLPNEKPISKWEGTPVQPLVVVTGLNYPNVRRLSINKANGVDNENNTVTGLVRIYNSGTQPVNIKAVNLPNNTTPPNFSIDYANISPFIDLTNPINFITLHPQDAAGNNLVKVITVPITYNPQTIGVQNIEVVVDYEQNASISQAGNLITGSAFEPMVELTNYTFPNPTIVNRDHFDADGITKTVGLVEIQNITNNNVEAPLTISKISIDPTTNVGDFALINLPTLPLTIQPNDKFNLQFNFRPTVIGNRKIMILVESDAGPSKEATGGQRDPVDYSYTGTNGNVDGVGINIGAGVTNYDFGDVLLCNSPVGSVFFSNTSATNNLNLVVTPDLSTDVNSFVALDPIPTVLKPNETIEVRYQFNPDKVGNYFAKFSVDYDDPEVPDAEYTLIANGYKHKVSFELKDFISTDGKFGPGSLVPGYPVNIKIDDSPFSNVEWTNADIKTFKIDLRYNKDWISVIKLNNVYVIDKGAALTGNWDLAGEEKVDPTDPNFILFTITGVNTDGTGFVNANVNTFTQFVTLTIKLYLVGNGEFRPAIDVKNYSFENANGIRNKCIDAVGGDAIVSYNICVQNLRDVTISTTQFSFEGPDARIVTTPTIDVRFNVAFDAETKLEVINSNGDVVGIPFDARLKAGVYEANIPTQELNSGSYFIRFNSGPFNETIKILLQK